MTDFHHHQFECNAVIVLNNTAITMMERSHHHQAASTIRDAIHVLQRIASENPRSQAQGMSFAAERLEKASCHMFNPRQPSSSVHVPIKVAHHNGMGLQCLTPCLINEYPMIRLETFEDIHLLELSAILLYNYSICILCRARNTEQDRIANLREQGARKTLEMALSMLSNLCEDAKCPFVTHRLMSLMLMAGDVLAQTLVAQGQVEEARRLKATLLDDLVVEVKELSSCGLFSFEMSASAAA
jgi:hypothetical protein